MYRFLYLLFITLLLFQMKVSAQLEQPELGELFRDDVVPRIDIYLPADSLAWILDDDNIYSDDLFSATFIFDNGTVLDTMENVGFRLRGNTSREADKKSFKIDFNSFQSGRKYRGVEKINLNGQHNDPTISRAKICADLARNMNIPSLRSNHVELYINDAYHGLYINVEHVDEEYVEKRFGNKNGNLYKCLYPADLDYKGTDPNLYKEEFWGRRAYELKINTNIDDYSDLAHFIDIINNTPTSQLPCLLEPIFNVDQYLKSIVFDILTGNWDGPIYNKNNFYLYHNESTDKLEYIPFDLDNTMGLDWLDRDWGTRNIYTWNQTGQPRPIYTSIIVVPEYRDRFSYYMNETINELFNETAMFPYLDDMRNSISAFVANDTFYNMDYGFDFNDFNIAFDNGIPFFQVEDYGIKSYISSRKNNALNQLVLNDISPIISQVSNNYPSENQDIFIQANIIDDNSLGQVKLCYSLQGGSENCIDMYDDGMHNDESANDGVYGIIIPAINQATVFEYYISASDDVSQEAIYPICGNKNITIQNSNLTLAINEFMASNASTIADEFGEYDDWIEIYNYGNSVVYLGDKYLTDNPSIPNKWMMPDISINPNEYIIFWADNNINQGIYHTNFKLSASGEFIGLFDNEGNNFALIDNIDFGIQIPDISYGRIPNGTGIFMEMGASPGSSNFITNIDDSNNYGLEISCRPNPFHDELNISIINDHNLDLEIEIINLLGQKIYENKIESSFLNNINSSTFANGMYFINITSNHQIIYSQKLIHN